MISPARARRMERARTKGKKIAKVDAVEDAIVFTGTTHTEFVNYATQLLKYHDT